MTDTATDRAILESVADVGIVVHNHWTQDDVNDGKKVYVDLVNRRNECIGSDAEVGQLKVRLVIKGLDTSYEDYTVLLCDQTTQNVQYSDISYPRGEGIVILYSDLAEYDQECCTAIWAEVTLSDGRVVKNLDPYDFDIEPVQYQGP